MVDIYKIVDGEKIERVIARTDEAQTGMRHETTRRAAIARRILADSHTGTHHAKIELDHGKIDDYIVLNDEAPNTEDRPWFAHVIEFGHVDKKTGRFVKGPAPLRKAVGLMWLDD